MPSSRPFLVSLLACPTLLLSSAVVQPAVPPRPLASPARLVGEADGGAMRLLDQALALLGPGRLQWLEVEVWQRMTCEDLTYEAKGSLLTAPGNRRRLVLEITSGRAKGQVQMLSDGKRFYSTSQVGQGRPAVWQTDLPKQAAACEGLFQQQGIGGPAGLLAVIRYRLQQPRRELVQWDGRQVVRITGDWPAVAGRQLPPGTPAELVARHCRLYLDAATLWPYRVEWWGTDGLGCDVLLSEIEYRDPILNQPLPEQRCQREFTYRPA
jgi:hypothetical protein